ncbi:GNAT family N-acetyltransferase [Sphingobium nicotianae]|uniref:GNAT family N-acetyltransferase n=1 Tax=Sphingobium nicotianae TaxID=2782607 RepID=A0A9X1ISS6_9SPHN|nr:GNAT family N-acetyltransferase [Sphingobium nicotianae]MBT2188833.1 GNAT family N-acetyltransferase [Sphingobium nicotianae]
MNAGPLPIQSRSVVAQTAALPAVRAGDGDDDAWLMDACAEPNPFYLPALLDPALAMFDAAHAVHLIEARDAHGALIGRLPVTPGNRHGRFPIRHVVNWQHHHCFFGAPLLRAGHEREGWQQILAALDAAPWAGPFLHLRGIDADGPVLAALRALCAVQGRRFEEVGRYERAMLRSHLDADAYWTENVRAKKRKELRRLQSRLAEMGEIVHRHLTDPGELGGWVDAFLRLEAKGWKGEQGTALGSRPEDTAFLRAACAAALDAGLLDMLRIDCAGQPIAMLINFANAQGGFSFKIAIDPEFARYSPGVLIEQDNLARVLDDRITPWMDSCAAAGHPMIDSLWGERRMIAQYRIGLDKGLLGSLALSGMSLAERAYAMIKGARA